MSTEPQKPDHGADVASEHGMKRSPHWAVVEKAYRKDHPDCIYCGSRSGQKYGIQVHHIHAFHVVVGVGRPDLELDPRNLTSLCESEKDKPAPDHHISEGHLGSFQRNNDRVVDDAPQFLGQSREQIEATSLWQSLKASAPSPFSSWTHEQKRAYRASLDKVLPPDQGLCAKYGFVIKDFI